MPIYEFRCKKCKHIFESLIFSRKKKKPWSALNAKQKMRKKSCRFLPAGNPTARRAPQRHVPVVLPAAAIKPSVSVSAV